MNNTVQHTEPISKYKLFFQLDFEFFFFKNY